MQMKYPVYPVLYCVLSGGGVSVVGGMVQLVLLLQELWRRSEKSGETLPHTKVSIFDSPTKTKQERRATTNDNN